MVYLIIFIIVIFIIWMLLKGRKKDKTGNEKLKIFEIKESIFEKYDISSISESKIRDALTTYQHSIAYCFIGTLENNTEFALLIGTSDEWVNVITLNRAKDPKYGTYGFSIKESRWSYGSKVYCAQEIRDIIKANKVEILELIKTQESARIEKEENRKQQEIEDKRFEKEFEKQSNSEEKQLKKMQLIFKPVIEMHFSTVKFDFNNNKAKYQGALKECENHYFDINLEDQTCNCEEFKNNCSMYEKFDTRRLCNHLFNIIKYRELFANPKDPFEKVILNFLQKGFLGIYKGILNDNLKYAIIIYSWSDSLHVVTPKTNKDGYVYVKWELQGKEWIPKSGGKEINKQIQKTTNELFLI